MTNEYLIQKYIGLCNISGLQKEGGNYKGRCPVCGDSKQDSRKKRFYILLNNNKQVVYCHNCLYSTSFTKFMQEYKPAIYEDYKRELLFSGKRRRDVEIKSKSYHSLKEAVEKVSANNSVLDLLDRPSGDALELIKKRKFPESLTKTLYYTDNYMKFLHDSGLKKFDKIPDKDRRIVIPYFDEKGVLIYLQGRAIDEIEPAFRYLTTIVKEDSPKIWGLNNINTDSDVRVLEGVFDACFVNNSIAFGGSAGEWKYVLNKIEPSKITLLLDNDLRTNKHLKKVVKKVIDKGVKIFFFPKTIKEKDINEMIMNGYTEKSIEELISKNTFSGIQAKVRLKLL